MSRFLDGYRVTKPGPTPQQVARDVFGNYLDRNHIPEETGDRLRPPSPNKLQFTPSPIPKAETPFEKSKREAEREKIAAFANARVLNVNRLLEDDSAVIYNDKNPDHVLRHGTKAGVSTFTNKKRNNYIIEDESDEEVIVKGGLVVDRQAKEDRRFTAMKLFVEKDMRHDLIGDILDSPDKIAILSPHHLGLASLDSPSVVRAKKKDMKRQVSVSPAPKGPPVHQVRSPVRIAKDIATETMVLERAKQRWLARRGTANEVKMLVDDLKVASMPERQVGREGHLAAAQHRQVDSLTDAAYTMNVSSIDVNISGMDSLSAIGLLIKRRIHQWQKERKKKKHEEMMLLKKELMDHEGQAPRTNEKKRNLKKRASQLSLKVMEKERGKLLADDTNSVRSSMGSFADDLSDDEVIEDSVPVVARVYSDDPPEVFQEAIRISQQKIDSEVSQHLRVVEHQIDELMLKAELDDDDVQKLSSYKDLRSEIIQEYNRLSEAKDVIEKFLAYDVSELSKAEADELARARSTYFEGVGIEEVQSSFRPERAAIPGLDINGLGNLDSIEMALAELGQENSDDEKEEISGNAMAVVRLGDHPPKLPIELEVETTSADGKKHRRKQSMLLNLDEVLEEEVEVERVQSNGEVTMVKKKTLVPKPDVEMVEVDVEEEHVGEDGVTTKETVKILAPKRSTKEVEVEEEETDENGNVKLVKKTKVEATCHFQEVEIDEKVVDENGKTKTVKVKQRVIVPEDHEDLAKQKALEKEKRREMREKLLAEKQRLLEEEAAKSVRSDVMPSPVEGMRRILPRMTPQHSQRTSFGAGKPTRVGASATEKTSMGSAGVPTLDLVGGGFAGKRWGLWGKPMAHRLDPWNDTEVAPQWLPTNREACDFGNRDLVNDIMNGEFALLDQPTMQEIWGDGYDIDYGSGSELGYEGGIDDPIYDFSDEEPDMDSDIEYIEPTHWGRITQTYFPFAEVCVGTHEEEKDFLQKEIDELKGIRRSTLESSLNRFLKVLDEDDLRLIVGQVVLEMKTGRRWKGRGEAEIDSFWNIVKESEQALKEVDPDWRDGMYWNSKYQAIIDVKQEMEGSETTEKSDEAIQKAIQSFDSMTTIVKEFHVQAELLSRVIISEMFLPYELKSIKPDRHTEQYWRQKYYEHRVEFRSQIIGRNKKGGFTSGGLVRKGDIEDKRIIDENIRPGTQLWVDDRTDDNNVPIWKLSQWELASFSPPTTKKGKKGPMPVLEDIRDSSTSMGPDDSADDVESENDENQISWPQYESTANIKPPNAGKERYHCQGILFRFGVNGADDGEGHIFNCDVEDFLIQQDNSIDPTCNLRVARQWEGCKVFGQNENMMKAVKHKIKALHALMTFQPKDTYRTPMVAIIDYRGYRIQATSATPLDVEPSSSYKSNNFITGKHTPLAYGSYNLHGLRWKTDNENVLEHLTSLASALGVRRHTLGRKCGEKAEVPLNADLQIRMATSDNRMYMMEFTRLLAPEMPPSDMVAMFNTRMNLSIRRENLITVPVRLFRAEFLYRFANKTLNSNQGVHLNADIFSGYVHSSGDRDKDTADINKATEFLHNRLMPELVQEMSFRSSENVSIDEELHRRGINLRHLGRIALLFLRIMDNSSAENPEGWYKTCLIEMGARTIKNILREEIQANQPHGLLLEIQVQQIVAKTLNEILQSYDKNFIRTLFGEKMIKKFFHPDMLKPNLSAPWEKNAITPVIEFMPYIPESIERMCEISEFCLSLLAVDSIRSSFGTPDVYQINSKDITSKPRQTNMANAKKMEGDAIALRYHHLVSDNANLKADLVGSAAKVWRESVRINPCNPEPILRAGELQCSFAFSSLKHLDFLVAGLKTLLTIQQDDSVKGMVNTWAEKTWKFFAEIIEEEVIYRRDKHKEEQRRLKLAAGAEEQKKKKGFGSSVRKAGAVSALTGSAPQKSAEEIAQSDREAISKLSKYDDEAQARLLATCIKAMAVPHVINWLSDYFKFQTIQDWREFTTGTRRLAIDTLTCHRSVVRKFTARPMLVSLRKEQKKEHVTRLKELQAIIDDESQLVIQQDDITAHAGPLLEVTLDAVHKIDLAGSEIDCKSFASGIANSRMVEEIILSHCSIEPDGAKSLCSGLVKNVSTTSLDLSNNHIGSSGLQSFIQLFKSPGCNLKHLNISNNDVGYGGAKSVAESISYSTSLETLDITNCMMTSKGVAAIADAIRGTKSLKQLTANYVFDVESFRSEELKEYEIASNFLHEPAEESETVTLLVGICRMSLNLNRLVIKNMAFNSQGAQAVASYLAELKLMKTREENPIEPSLTEIDLNGREDGGEFLMKSAGCSIIAGTIRENSFLTVIRITQHNIGERGCAEIARSLKGNPDNCVTELNLSSNNIAFEGAVALGQFISSSFCRLKILNLENNNIGTDDTPQHEQTGLIKLCLSIRDNSTLTHLVLANNNLGKEGGEIVGGIFIKGKNKGRLSIQALNIGKNNMGIEGIMDIHELLLKNPCKPFREIDTSENGLTTAQLNTLRETFAEHMASKRVSIYCWDL